MLMMSLARDADALGSIKVEVDIVNGPNKFIIIDAYSQIDHYIACMEMLLYRQIANFTGDRRQT